ncbi:SGNH/GDSL hydrolase family protein [Telluria mixta]|uniref:SGNH/GDSL hydrolase family protein n=1 Tax=Telluria mixta TaxID=34071 RepID=A0ABT2BWZ4_9BURK|nr:SGNH/GDSL hydrolase family protein [Telluria mixta]MCS0629658.1 SGNH/GDSL hydrolase family protein [Telluria mixta]WEM96774.1 SGNH/GDSL hydrolase family protein [Telluria mixta]
MPKSIAALTLSLLLSAHALAQENWTTSWYAAPQPAWDATFALPMNVPTALDNATVRETVRLSAGGQRIRLVFSNRYGHAPVTLGAVRVGPADDPRATRALTFSGQPGAAILPGATVTSDPVALPVRPLSRLAVTTSLPAPTTIASFHWGAQQTMHIDSAKVGGRLFLSAVLVESAKPARTVVALGDSITDGNGSTPDADRRWPDILAERLAPHGIAVANAGISGGRLARDGMGVSALARLEQDVLSQPGVSDVIVLLGINDIGWPGSPFAPGERPATLEELTAAYRDLVAASHVRGVRVTAGTLPPFEGALAGTPYAGHYSPDKECLRRQLNDWIRTAGAFDAVVDFDAVLHDPARPGRMRADFDSGDHLHPGDAGYRAMAGAIDIARLLARD